MREYELSSLWFSATGVMPSDSQTCFRKQGEVDENSENSVFYLCEDAMTLFQDRSGISPWGICNHDQGFVP